jgi:hypothetical protein
MARRVIENFVKSSKSQVRGTSFEIYEVGNSEKIRKISELAGQLRSRAVQLRLTHKSTPYCRNPQNRFPLALMYS